MAKTAPTYPEFILEFPAFAEVSQPVVTRAITLSARLLEPLSWGDFYSDAVGLDAAHNLVLSQMSAQGVQGAAQVAVGAVTSVSGAGLSTSFATPSLDGKSKSDNWYMKTGYGQQFLRLRSVVIAPGMMV